MTAAGPTQADLLLLQASDHVELARQIGAKFRANWATDSYLENPYLFGELDPVQVGAIVFLVSDALLSQPLLRDQSAASILAQFAGKVFRVNAAPVERELGWLASIAEPLGPSEQPLATMSDAERTEVIGAISEQLENVLGKSGKSARYEPPRSADAARKGQAQQAVTQDVSPDDAPNASSDGSESADARTVPLDLLRVFKTVESIPTLLEKARDLATGVNPPLAITTSTLLFAITELRNTPGPWAPQFLYDTLTRYTKSYETVRDRYFQKYGARGVHGRRGGAATVPVAMTGYVHAALEQAREFAKRTSKSEEIHARHLLAALLQSDDTKEKSGALNRLGEMGVAPGVVREALYDWVRGQGDDDAAWASILLEPVPDVRRLGGFSADRVGTKAGADLLDIEPDVRALGALIAARTVYPPLSIGLFGEWGSGKTFFMRSLRTTIDSLSKDSRDSGQMQRDVPFYKHIVQIEFNAWHYVEGNLWASLVEHILENLYPREDPSVSRRLQEDLIKKLAQEKALAQATSTAVDTARAAAGDAAKELHEAQDNLDRKTKELAKLNADHVRRDFVLTGAAAPIQSALEQLGLTKAGDKAVELEAALRQIHGVLDRGQRFFTSLTRGKDRNRRLFWLFASLLGAPVMVVLVHWVMQRLGSTASDIYAYATGAATLAGAGATWLKKQAEWMSKRLDEAETAQKAFDAEMAKATAEHVQQVTQAEQKLRELTAALNAALQKHAEAKDREAAAAAELKAATTGRLLANFISDRASSADYRKHLGVLALVRDDFEKLSGLIEEENWKLSPDDSEDPPPTPGLTRYQSLDEEAVDHEQRINRIVLYIDDLDRCPPNKVVDVLQAVHLLLAFPLFVVVVGVDARWITRSLQTKYRELLLMGAKSNAADDDTALLGSVSPNDYLEKIFQIPFWLKQMEPDDCDRMVRGLLRSSRARRDDSSENGNATKPNQASRPEQAADEPNATPVSTGVSGSGALPSTPATPNDTARAPASANATPADQKPVAPPIESLEITTDELDFMQKLAPVLGRSPRALKRFANVYRLIKVGLAPHQQLAFLRPRAPLADYQLVLFLLAIDTGTPTIARAFFEAIKSARGRDVKWLLTEMEPKMAQDPTNVDWRRFKEWIDNEHEIVPRTMKIDALTEWGERVRRYSFEVGRT